MEVMQFFFYIVSKSYKREGKKVGVDTNEICDWMKRGSKLEQGVLTIIACIVLERQSNIAI